MKFGFLRFFLLLSLFSFSFSSSARIQKVKTYVGTLELVGRGPEKPRSFVLHVSDSESYFLSVPEHIVGVALLNRGKRVEVKGILKRAEEVSLPNTGVIRVKNLDYKPLMIHRRA